MKIGFIGTGVMGTGMIANLIKAGNEVQVYNRTKAHAQTVLDLGATWCDSPPLAMQNCEVVMSIVGYPKDVEQIYFGKDGLLNAAVPGQYLIDMTTSRPALDQKIAAAAPAGVHILDAPVSGGDLGAKNADCESLTPLFKQIGKDVNWFGLAGSGQHAKMANQIMIAGTMTGMCEMLVYAKAAGLDLPTVIKTVGGGAAANWSLDNYAPRILKNDFTPGFFAKHFLKDLRIALDEAARMKLQLPATKEAARLYEILVDEKQLGNDGTQALIKLWWN